MLVEALIFSELSLSQDHQPGCAPPTEGPRVFTRFSIFRSVSGNIGCFQVSAGRLHQSSD